MKFLNIFKKDATLFNLSDLYFVIQAILRVTMPFIRNLIESKVVPTIKRKAYETLDKYADKVINDLAQNAAKIKNETDEIKKLGYEEGTKLGIDMLRALAEKLNKAADEIEKVIL